ncbi:MAG TPA: hypothetical protein VNO21_12860 [Polyangiaceae bacterium]|nr:hypothetical protein [Polyangiaceae bacterium]
MRIGPPGRQDRQDQKSKKSFFPSPGVPGALAVSLLLLLAGCAGRSVPDPKDAAKAYADAASRGNGDAIYEMMTESARKERSRDEVRRLVATERVELREQAQAFSAKDARAQATARLRFRDGEETALELKDGKFWVTSAGAMPGGARTPEEALDQLRRVVARRSYAGLMRVLSPGTRAAIEQDLRSLVSGLEHPESLPVQMSGDSATVNVTGGHHVRLKREGGIWRIDDFD